MISIKRLFGTKTSSSKVLDLVDGIMKGSRYSLAKSITLIESKKKEHQIEAEKLLSTLSSSSNNKIKKTNNDTFRIGIAGPPGAGKSTFIERLGLKFIKELNQRVAVLAVDPSSHITGGSIMGDKTRMDILSNHNDAYVRGTPTSGVLGGIAAHTADVLYLCEACNYDIIIVESVGLGQSEVEIDQAVDVLILVIPPGGGDDLQASKKGIMEAADIIIVNKADGNFLTSAKHTKADYNSYVQFLRKKDPNWKIKVMMHSNITNKGFENVFNTLLEYKNIMKSSGSLTQKRKKQSKHWMWTHLKRELLQELNQNRIVNETAENFYNIVSDGSMSSRVAARKLLKRFLKKEN